MSGQKFITCSAVCLASPQLHAASREVPSSASCVQTDRGLFVVDLDEPNSVDESRVQEGVCSECLCTYVGGSSWLAIWCAM